MRISDLVRGKILKPESTTDSPKEQTPPKGFPEPEDINKSIKLPDEPVEAFPEQRAASEDISCEKRANMIYKDAVSYLKEVKEKLQHSQEPLNLDRPVALIEQMIKEPSLVDQMYQLTLAFETGDDAEISGSVNSMIYCFKIGVRMGYTPSDLMEICLAALHHDIGMFLIPGSILNKTGELSASELAIVKKHTEAARDLLRPYDHIYPRLSRAVYEHHEREGGQGYPLGIKGDRICEFAKIIGICDSYEAMTHNRPHKKATAQYMSVLELAETKDQFFSPHIIKVFLDELTLYPVGSYVRLNNKAIGIVVKTNRNNPFKPTVRLVSDGQGDRISDERLVDLADTTILNIAAGISADEVPA